MTDKLAAAEQSQWRNLETQTGKSKAQWLKLATAKKLDKHSEMVAWLKNEHGIGHGYANLIAIRARETASGGTSTPDDLVLSQSAGAKTALKPIYDNVIATVQGFGTDVEVAPKKGYVSLRRSKQFAIVQPSTASRLDIGLNLKGVAPSGRLQAGGSFNAMCTHRIRIEGEAALDANVKKWLKQAYDAA